MVDNRFWCIPGVQQILKVHTKTIACSVVSILLAASGAAAQFKHPSFADFSGTIDPKNTNVHTTVPGPNHGQTTSIVTGVRGTAESVASSLTASADLHASAGVTQPTSPPPYRAL